MPSRGSTTKIAILDDDRDLRTMLATYFGLHPEVEVLATFASVRQCVDAVPHIELDILIVDYRLPDGTGLEAVRALRRLRAVFRTVMYSGEASIPPLAAAGEIDEFVRKDRTPADLLDAIRRVSCQVLAAEVAG